MGAAGEALLPRPPQGLLGPYLAPGSGTPSGSGPSVGADPRRSPQPTPAKHPWDTAPGAPSAGQCPALGTLAPATHLLVALQHSRDGVLWCQQGPLFLQAQPGQQTASLVVTLGSLFSQPGHGVGLLAVGTEAGLSPGPAGTFTPRGEAPGVPLPLFWVYSPLAWLPPLSPPLLGTGQCPCTPLAPRGPL